MHLIFHDNYHASTEALEGSATHKNSVTLVRLWNYYPLAYSDMPSMVEATQSDTTSLDEYERVGREILAKPGHWEPSSIPGEIAYVVD